jgi:hypothetical protein
MAIPSSPATASKKKACAGEERERDNRTAKKTPEKHFLPYAFIVYPPHINFFML